MFCVQVAKLFSAQRRPQLENNIFAANTTVKQEFVLHKHLNASGMQIPIQSDIEYAYFIDGALAFIGTVLQILSWFYSGCKFSHWIQHTEEDVQSSTSQKLQIYRLSKFSFSVASILLCIFVFFALTNGASFVCFGIIFAVKTLNWTKSDASNLITVVFVSELVSKCVSIFCAKFVHVHKLMIIATLMCLGGTLFVTFAWKAIPLSLWIGASLLGLGFGNMEANSLNEGKRLTSQAGIIVSLITASAYTGQIVAPLVTGYLHDNVDPMWFLYVSVVYSASMLVHLVGFLAVLMCNQNNKKDDCVEQECDLPLENELSEQKRE